MALVALLVQGVLGSVAPAAVLCLHLGSCGSSGAVEVAPTNCVSDCCHSHSHEEIASVRAAVAIAPPCDDDCQDCVDIGLPDVDLFSVDRESIQADELTPAAMAVAIADVQIAHIVDRPSVRATGPPGRLACLHGLIIRSTRLLI